MKPKRDFNPYDPRTIIEIDRALTIAKRRGLVSFTKPPAELVRDGIELGLLSYAKNDTEPQNQSSDQCGEDIHSRRNRGIQKLTA